MLEPDIIRATGESVSRAALVVGFLRPSCCKRGDCLGGTTGFVGLLLGGSSRGSSGGGAAGNLKLCEKEFEGFRVVGRAGVLGVVVMAGRLRPERDGKAKSGGGDEPERGEGCVAERWPGEATGYEFGRPGTTCRLAERAWPRGGRRMGMPLSWLPSVVAFVASEMMDRERPCLRCSLLLLLLAAGVAPGVRGGRRSPAADGLWSDSAGRWLRAIWGGGWAETNDELRDIVGLVEEWTGGSLRWRSWCLVGGDDDDDDDSDGGSVSRGCGGATLRKVIVHSMSSPAKTVESFHRTKTRMLEAEADMAVEGPNQGRRGRAAGRVQVAAAHRARRSSSMATTSRHGRTLGEWQQAQWRKLGQWAMVGCVLAC